MPGLANGVNGVNGIHSPGPEDDQESAPQSSVQNQGSGVRRTTPIYQHFDQAYTSITGGTSGLRVASPPGTDSLNNVYARAMAADEAAASYFGDAPVQFPFQGSTSSENIDQDIAEDTGDNPAGMNIESNDVALRPILRSVPRSSVTYSVSLPREPSDLTFLDAAEAFRSRAPSTPVRAPTPFPGSTSASSGIDSTIAAIVGQYGDAEEASDLAVDATGVRDSSSSIDERPVVAAPSNAEVLVHPRQRRNVPAAGPPPAWPLPIEPLSVPIAVGGNIARFSSSPPTYGTTTALLDQGQHTVSRTIALRHDLDVPRTSSLYSSEADEIIALRGNSTTPFDQIGDPGPSVPSSPRTSSPVRGVMAQPRTYDADVATHFDQSRARDDHDQPSSSSAVGIALTSMDDPIVRYEHNSQDPEMLRVGLDTDDDAAWETTQGTNTQRNSAVPDGDLAALSSTESLSRQATSTWDPLGARIHGVEEIEREFAELVRTQRANVLGETSANTPETSTAIASPREPVQVEFSTSLASQEQTSMQTPTSRVHGNNNYLQSLPGSSLLLRTPQTTLPISDTIVEMSSDTASDNNEQAARIAAAEEEIRRYGEPSKDPSYCLVLTIFQSHEPTTRLPDATTPRLASPPTDAFSNPRMRRLLSSASIACRACCSA